MHSRYPGEMRDESSMGERAWWQKPAWQNAWFRVVHKLHAARILRVRKGHYYSPIVSTRQLRRDADRVFDTSLRELAGVDLNDRGQRALLTDLAAFYGDQPFASTPRAGLRYYFDNHWYGQADGLFLHMMLRRFRPQRVIEIGSGFSSAVMLDTSERFLESGVQFTFVEPRPKRLRALLKEGDRDRVEIVERRIQDVDPSVVSQLAANDILFIDSSHVSKAGSDVNHILFELLPRLSSGVLIHFHDVLYPFEYPQKWFELGFSWNEPYLLRAFLQYNSHVTIRLWTDFVQRFHREALENMMPLCVHRPALGLGGSLWLQTV